MVSSRGSREACTRPENNRCKLMTTVKMRQKRWEYDDPPAVLRPSSSEMENVSRRLAAPHCHTNSGDTSVMNAADTNLLLMVSG